MPKPWYADVKKDLIQATNFFVAACERNIRADESFKVFKTEFQKATFGQFIFESNQIEGEGLPEGDTKELIVSMHDLEWVRKLTDVNKLELDVKKTDFDPMDPLKNITVSLKYKDREREYWSVLGHSIGLARIDTEAMRVIANKMKMFANYHDNLVRSGEPMEEFTRNPWYVNLYSIYHRSTKKEYFLGESLAKQLHVDLSIRSKNQSNGGPGEYRPRAAHIDGVTVFLEPSRIEPALVKLVVDHRRRLDTTIYNPIVEACRIKEEFIKIHPFGDFNGRISRLMMSGFLYSEGYPFVVILRSSSAAKKRYFEAMKAAFRGNPLKLVSLYSKAIISQLESVNSRLIASGLNPIQPMEMAETDAEVFLQGLDLYSRECLNFRG